MVWYIDMVQYLSTFSLDQCRGSGVAGHQVTESVAYIVKANRQRQTGGGGGIHIQYKQAHATVISIKAAS